MKVKFALEYGILRGMIFFINLMPLPEYDAITEENIRQICASSIKPYEAFIRENPEQWFNLFHRLWTKKEYPKNVQRSLFQIFL